MGIDIEIYIRTEPTSDLLGKLRALKDERTEDGWARYPVIDSVSRRDGFINISSCSRYFGKYYLRGWWPSIKESLLAIRDVCPPGTQIEYGDDAGEYEVGVPISDEWLAEMDALWATTGKEDDHD